MSRGPVFVARAPVRVDAAGGGSDAPPFCIEYGGAVVNFGVINYVHARLEVLADTKKAVIESVDLAARVEADSVDELEIDGALVLLKAIARRMKPESGFILSVESGVPPGSGLGSSGAVGVACVGAFDAAAGTERSREETAAIGNAVERDDLGWAGGSQDSYGPALGGINLITYHQGGGLSTRRLNCPEKVYYEIERRGILVYTGDVHLSGSIHKDIKASYALPNSPTVDAMKQLARIAGECAEALEAGEVDRFGQSLDDNWVQHQRLHESCNNDTLRRFYDAAAAHIVGGKTCGAGGGGCVLFIAKEGRRRELENRLKELGGKLLPFGIDRQGLVTWNI